MKKYSWIFILIILLNTTSFCFSVEIQKAKIVKQVKPVEKIDEESELYKLAEIELDPYFYRVFRIAERVIRANKLDDRSWRIYIPYKKNMDNTINAYADQGNLIILLPDLVQSIDDVSVLAFVIAHEIAHQTQNHMAKSQRDAYNFQNKIKDLKAKAEYKADDLSQESFFSSSFLGYPGNLYAKKEARKTSDELERELENLNVDYQTQSRKMEYEADKLGLEYMIKAGFKPEGAEKFFEFFETFSASFDDKLSTHPQRKNRLYQVNSLAATLDIQSMKQEGLINIKNSKALTFEKIMDSGKKFMKMIKINSKEHLYEEPPDQFKKLFGK